MAVPPLFPVSLVLEGRPVLLVGGRRTALGRAELLLAARARLSIVASELDDELVALARAAGVECARRAYEPGEAAGYALVVAATGDGATNATILADADRAGVFCNAVDDLEHSSVHLPAIWRGGPMTVAVSSGAASPALARFARDEIARVLGDELVALAEVLAPIRSALRAAGHSSEGRDWFGLIDELRPLLARGELAAGRQAAEAWLAAELAR